MHSIPGAHTHQCVSFACEVYLEEVRTKLTGKQIGDNWPESERKPASVSLWHLLDRCVERGEDNREGTGTKTHPFGYWPPSVEKWQTDPLARLETIAEAKRGLPRLEAKEGRGR